MKKYAKGLTLHNVHYGTFRHTPAYGLELSCPISRYLANSHDRDEDSHLVGEWTPQRRICVADREGPPSRSSLLSDRGCPRWLPTCNREVLMKGSVRRTWAFHPAAGLHLSETLDFDTVPLGFLDLHARRTEVHYG